MDAPRFVLLARDLGFLRHSELHQGDDLDQRAHALTRALARSPIWERMGPGVLVLRTGPVPTLAALGRFDEADVARLTFLARWLGPAVAATRYLDHAAVERAVDTLAERLRSAFGDEVRHFDFAAVPRGGLIVLGMLAYALDIDADRLTSPHDAARPLVIVDDCALTGSRFRRFVADDRRAQWVFAHLCSHPELRASLLAAETRLSHAIAAFDLRDLAPEAYEEGHRAWRARVEAQAGSERYWIGQPENVVFPWSEPDHNFWNAVTEELEWGWRLAPPERCRKSGATSFPEGIPVHVQGGSAGGRRVADHLVYAPFEGNVHLLDRENGRSLRLDAVASRVWDGLVAGCTMDTIADDIVSHFDVDVERARADVQSLTHDLMARGVLERA